MHSGFAGAGNKECLDEKNGTGETRQGAPVCNPFLQACGFLVPPCPHPGQPGLLRPTEPGLGLLAVLSPQPPPPQGIFLFLLLKNRASVRINGHPPKLLKRRHYICTDLICGAARYRRTGTRRSRIPIIWRGGSCGGSSGGLAAAEGWQRRME